jgi:hypothetical protein
VYRALEPEDEHEYGEADGCFRSRHCHDKEYEYHAIDVTEQIASRDESKVRTIQHELDAHEDDDCITPGDNTYRPYDKKGSAQGKIETVWYFLKHTLS